MNDLKFAFRQLLKNPGFTAVAVLTLALGIGANTAIFSLINAAMLKALPVKNPESIVLLGSRGKEDNKTDFGFYYPVFRKLREQNQFFDDVAAFAPVPLNVRIDGQPEPMVPGQLISGSYLSLLGVNAVAGRNISAEDDQVPGGHPVAMISYGYWQRRFARAPSAIGKVVQLNGTSFTIVGVAPPRFFGMEVGSAPEIMVPLMMQPQMMPAVGSWLDRPVNVVNWLHVVGRLKPATAREQVQSAANALYRHIMADEAATTDPKWAQSWLESKLVVTPGSRGFSALRRQFAEPLTILMILVALVLLVACANVANLLLARAAGRRREIAIRFAIGAGRTRLIRQLLTESVLLAAIGAVGGLLLANWISGFVVDFISAGRMPIVLNLRPDLQVFTFVTALSVLTAILFGLVPALRATGFDLTPALKSTLGRTGNAAFASRTANVLVVSQVALSFLLLIGAGLFVRSLQKLVEQSAGFEPDHVLVVRVEPEGSDQKRGANAVRLNNLYRDLRERMEAIPGVRSASFASLRPTASVSPNRKIKTQTGEEIDVSMTLTFPKYFVTLGVPVVDGREFIDADMTPNAPPVAIINETLARRAFPNQNPIGQQFQFGNADPFVTIVGVVKDVKYGNLRSEVLASVYQPFLQANTGRGQMVLHVRVAGPANTTIASVQREILSVDPSMPAFQVQTLAAEFDALLMQERLVSTLSSLFGITALFLACIGLYGILAYAVTQRTAEIGIRLALGAQRRDVFGLILRQGMRLTGAGIAVGVIGALATARLLQSFLFGVAPTDLLTFIAILLSLSVVALAACWLPARRAAKVDPMEALRYE